MPTPDSSTESTDLPVPETGSTPRLQRVRTGKTKKKSGGSRGAEKSTTSSTFDPSLYINRELSWLEFNQRVLDEAKNERHPLLERAKFLAIVSSNLDEFFMIRVAAIKEQILANLAEISPDGRTPGEQIKAVHDRVLGLLSEMSSCFWSDIHPKLRAAGIHLLHVNELTEQEQKTMSSIFARDIFPVLTPLAFDPGHPFPYISNLSLNLAVVVSTKNGEERFARVKVPDVLPRLVEVPGSDGKSVKMVWLEELIASNLKLLFPGFVVKESYVFRVTRDADIEIQEDEAEDLISSIEEQLRLRRFGVVVRVGVEASMPSYIRDVLVDNLQLTQDDVYSVMPPLGLGHLMALLKVQRPELKDPPLQPALPFPDDDSYDIFSRIREGDILLHHPYDSFAPVVQFIRQAVHDPNVLAIKQTLYRIGKESPLIPLLIEAAEEGKQVAVLVELKARFDEENNIGWAKQLERAGIHVVYGLVGLKTHGKMALVVRKESNRLRRYVHLGTGNYNSLTSRLYTDFSFFTCNEEITGDVTEVFNFLTGYSQTDSYRKLGVAPVNLRKALTKLIERETAIARGGGQGRIIMKMNALTDGKMIELLYEASRAGVQIDLIVRGICCLRPGIKGISENIRVRSIVGRFLEHSRVFYFEGGGKPEYFLSSADLMGRNLDRRVELMFPISSPALTALLKTQAFDLALRDTQGACILKSDGTYIHLGPAPGEAAQNCQAQLLQIHTLPATTRQPVPRESPQS
jgi:polyphosphate kinase